MNKKAIIKYKHKEELGFMHYVVFNGEVVVLSVEDSKKVSHIREHGNLDVTFFVDKHEYGPVEASVNNDPKYVEAVYNYMVETNNAYFKDGFEGLCAIKFIR